MRTIIMELKKWMSASIITGSFFCLATSAVAQATQKTVNNQLQGWISVNSTMHFTNKWGVMADLHVRRNNFVSDPSFYFARLGVNYWLQEKFTLAGGYAHMWLAPSTNGWKTFANEHRIFQQALMSSALGKTGLLLRLRNEQRWQEIMKNDASTGDWKFVNRVRYLTSFSFPVSKKPGKLAIVVADELLLNFGSKVVYNTFDQNRIFLGIRHKLNKDWAYDFGYMNLFQQKSAGNTYDNNHTIRWFFYYNHDFRHPHHRAHPRQTIDSREE